MKTCRSCGAEKPLGDFYEHKAMKDGLLSSCKECVRARVRSHRETNLARIRRYDCDRARLPHRRALAKRLLKDWRRRNPDKVSVQVARYPDKKHASTVLNNAVRDGRVTKPLVCSRCPSRGRIEGHHEDYAKPLDVDWLCVPCHKKADKARRARERGDHAS